MINTGQPPNCGPHLEDRFNKHELHWRQEPSKWKGNLEMAYKGLYPHLEEVIHCRNCGAVPCPLDHDEDKDRRLLDLEFVTDLIRSKKDLTEQVDKVGGIDSSG